MNVYDLLLDSNARISMGSKWLIFDDDGWTVLQKKYGQKKTRVLIETEIESEAIEMFLRED